MVRRFQIDPSAEVKTQADEFVRLGMQFEQRHQPEFAFEAYRRAWELMLTSQPRGSRFHKGRELACMASARLGAAMLREGFRWMLFAFIEDCLSRAEDSPTIQDELQWPAAQRLRQFGLTERWLNEVSSRTRRLARRRLVQDPSAVFREEGLDDLVAQVPERPQAQAADQVRVFVSSPMDLVPERILVADVCSELAVITRRDIRALLWEGAGQRHPESPPFTAEISGLGAQAVIDNRMRDALGGYDVYVGLIWRRMGTPTGRWRSGTEAEMRYALDGYRTGGRPRKLLFYVKGLRAGQTRLPGADDFINELSRDLGLAQRFRSKRDLRAMLVHDLAEAIG
jgi:hypothetical protein